MTSHRKLAAIMFTDIVGYTALMGRDEQKALDVLKRNREIHKKYIGVCGGNWLKEMGDGILISFESTSDAVYCAGAILNACSREEIQLRIGIHEGEVLIEENDAIGDGVNIASRIEELAKPNEILVSESVYRNIKNKPGIKIELKGEQQLKNVDEGIKVFKVRVSEEYSQGTQSEETVAESRRNWWKPALIVVGIMILLLLIVNILYFDPSGQSKASDRDKTIAVLPFKNLSPDENNQYFADGMMDAILNDLSKISDLKVIPATSVEQYRNTTKTASEIGNELSATFLLEGSALQFGENVRITTKLVDAENEIQIWSDNYDRQLDDIFLIHSEIAEQVSSSLHAELTIDEKQRIETTPTTNFVAYDFYLRGRDYAIQYKNKKDNIDYAYANTMYRRAIDEDPEFALVYAGLADLYYERNFFKEYMDEKPLDSVKILCNKALDLDPNLTDAYIVRANYHYWINVDYERAVKDMEKALEINPSSVRAMNGLSDIYQAEGDLVKSYQILDKANRLSKGIDNIQVWGNIGAIYLHTSEYAKANDFIENILRHQPDNVVAYGFLAHLNRCQGKSADNLAIAEKLLEINPEGRSLYDIALIYMMNERYEESEKYFRKMYDSNPDVVDLNSYGDKHMFSYVLIKNGKEQEAREHLVEIRDFMLEIVENERQWSKSIGYELAKTYSLLGETEEAIKWFQHYLDHGFTASLQDFAEYDPPFDNIRDDPRFRNIVEQGKVQVAVKRSEINELEQSLLLKTAMNN